jgi:hypothetical protein
MISFLWNICQLNESSGYRITRSLLYVSPSFVDRFGVMLEQFYVCNLLQELLTAFESVKVIQAGCRGGSSTVGAGPPTRGFVWRAGNFFT